MSWCVGLLSSCVIFLPIEEMVKNAASDTTAYLTPDRKQGIMDKSPRFGSMTQKERRDSTVYVLNRIYKLSVEAAGLVQSWALRLCRHLLWHWGLVGNPRNNTKSYWQAAKKQQFLEDFYSHHTVTV